MQQEKTGSPNTSWTILLIDDEEDIRQVTSLVLTDAGYHVITAADGDTGLQLARQNMPHITITDIRMPKMNGLQVLEQIKAIDSDMEVIVITAFGELDLAIKALQLDASDFITKPIDKTVLMIAVKRAQTRYANHKAIKEYTHLLEIEKARTLDELLKTYAFQKNLIQSSINGILGLDEAGKVIVCNPSMADLVESNAQDIVHRKTMADFFENNDFEAFNKVLNSPQYGGIGHLIMYETQLVSLLQNKIPVQVSASSLFHESVYQGLVCFFMDLRQVRKLEREVSDQARILHQDKMMSLGRLAASVVHEINNPLTGILNYLKLMLKITDRDEKLAEHRLRFRQYLELTVKETSRCSDIVSNLLKFSRQSKVKMGPIAVSELVTRCILLSQHKLTLSNISLKTDLDIDIPAITGDFNQIQQCLINLIFNALDAMQHGGTLTIGSRYHRHDDMVELFVKDTGSGIDPANLDHIFEPFFTTKNEGYGVGLGLSTVYGIMEAHGGKVRADSQPGNGTCFILSFPLSPNPHKEIKAATNNGMIDDRESKQ